MKRKFKILLLNTGYCSGLDGSLSNYFFHGYRFLFTPKKIENNISLKIEEMIKMENPDLICLIEVRKGSYLMKFLEKKYSFYDIEVKYGKKSFLKLFPFFYKNGNAFISKNKLKFKKIFLKNGSKKLAYEIILPGKIKLLMFHFSLLSIVRKEQFREIEKIIGKKGRKIVCGDFNIFNGFNEVNGVIKDLNLKIINNRPTFPSYKPRKFFDLFLCSKEIKTKIKNLNYKISDHLPVLIEITL
jgi:endonuclease/exonuclease/phosphatase family metal-dependent hydrolase